MKTAFVFPGQGSQSKGMLADIAAAHAEIEETFSEASETLGYDLWQLIQNDPEEKLNQTEYTQPALLVASVAMWRLFKLNNKLRPNLFAGHSLGEYTALVCANALSFADGVKLVQMRGRLMQQAVPDGVGAMAALLGLSDEDVRAVCQAATTENEIVSPANYNSVGQVVISGHENAVLRAIEIGKSYGLKRGIRLSLSVPSHCELMKPAALSLKEILKTVTLKMPSIPILQNVDVKAHDTVEGIRQALIEQLTHPVRWVETIQLMVNQGITHVSECGPGSVLAV